jgi:phenylalanine ammonia-lyase
MTTARRISNRPKSADSTEHAITRGGYVGTHPNPITISGRDLTVKHLVAVARQQAKIDFDNLVGGAVESSRSFLDQLLDQEEVIYGVNTGYGGNVKFLIPYTEINKHQENLLRFLSCGTGAPFPSDVIRGSILLRVNALSKGFSAIRMSTLSRLCDLLNLDIVPIVPRYGSVGASGDLIPSAYIARALLGEGMVWLEGREMKASEALQQVGLSPIELKAKEGLALVNGTSVMTSVAALAIHDTEYLTKLCVAAVALCAESLQATTDPFEESIHKVKNHPGQLEVARLLRDFTEGSAFILELESLREEMRGYHQRTDAAFELEEAIQNPYSIRCAPQGLGPIFDSLAFGKEVIEREMNSVNDNPLIDPHFRRVYHTGNFYGGHIARVMDGVKIDLANLANWISALMAMIVDPRFSNGLPPNLSEKPGLSSGFKGMQISLTSLICACRQMAGPSSIHTLPTEQYNQDIVSLGLHSATTAMDMIHLTRDAIAILLIALCQCIDLRFAKNGDGRMGKGTQLVYEEIRRQVEFLESDRPMDQDINRVSQSIQQRSFDILPMP